MYKFEIQGKYLNSVQRKILNELDKLIFDSPNIRKITLGDSQYNELAKLNKNYGLKLQLTYKGKLLTKIIKDTI